MSKTEKDVKEVAPAMSKITMLDKSGYVVTTEKAILVFDWYKDPEKALEKILKNHKHLPVIFFISSYGDNLPEKEKEKLKHKHEHELPRYEREELDPSLASEKHAGGHKRGEESHFNHDVFNLAQDRERYYVMSDDIAPKAIRTDVDVAWIHAGDTIDRLPGVVVKAYPTNEKGVSFLVTLPDGTTFFYGGEYRSWADQTDMTVVKDLFNGFVKSMHRLEEDVTKLTVLFFPVDTRLGDDCYQEARLVMQNINVRYFIPMQANGENYKEACDFPQYLTDNTEGICLHSPSQTVEINKAGIKAVPD